ncbi:MAG: divergent PAP2 family protein [bacterium]|nr:divergent PAP2 family protein [bacterium]
MYIIIILPLTATFLAQALKFFIKSNQKKFNLRSAFSYSGMPSGHSALVISLAVIMGLETGWDSPLFSFTAIYAFLVIRDALGLRRFIGRHSTIINKLVKDLGDDDVLEENYPKLIENIGHTIPQVVVGGLIGAVVSIVGYYYFNI